MQMPHPMGEPSSQGLCATASGVAALPAWIPWTSQNLGCISTPRGPLPDKMVFLAPAQVTVNEIPHNCKAGSPVEL